MTQQVYLDYNATAPLRPRARGALTAALEQVGNASSVHGFGRRARRIVEHAREKVAALVGAPAAGVVFTSGGTEANNTALRGARRERLLVSAGEHDSVLHAVEGAEPIPLRADGVVALDRLADMLAGDRCPALVSVMLANNETGVIQPLAQVVALARARGALVHCDAVQGVGKIPVDMTTLGIDLLSLSAHKIGGPQGVGALVVAERVDLGPLLRGGGQERRRRAGTENVAGIAGFGAAAQAAAEDLDRARDLAALRDAMEGRLRALAPELTVFGASAARLPNTSCFAVPGLRAETQVMALDLAGVAVSAGSACSSGKVAPSHVLRAMGAEEAVVDCAIRVSLGWNSGRADVERFLEAWAELYRSSLERARAPSPAA